MTKKANHTPEELRYLARGENTGEIPTAYDPTQHSENEGDIPAPFTGGDSNARQDQTMARLDETFQASGAEVIAEDGPEDGGADDPGQA